MPKLKPNKSVSSRCKITGTGKVRFNKQGKRHLNSHMTGKKLRQLRNPKFAVGADMKLLERELGRRLTPSSE